MKRSSPPERGPYPERCKCSRPHQKACTLRLRTEQAERQSHPFDAHDHGRSASLCRIISPCVWERSAAFRATLHVISGKIKASLWMSFLVKRGTSRLWFGGSSPPAKDDSAHPGLLRPESLSVSKKAERPKRFKLRCRARSPLKAKL